MEIRISMSGEPVGALPAIPVAGVGLLRGEFLLREELKGLEQPGMTAKLQAYIASVAEALPDKQVWYRVADLWSDEAAVLGGAEFEAPEQNPMLGNRGIRRAIARPDLLRYEVRATAEVASSFTNVNLLFPFVADADEFGWALDIAGECHWPNRIGSMIEVPSAVWEVPRMIGMGASNFLIGLNDLSCLLLGSERGPNTMKLHRSVWKAVEVVRDGAGGSAEWGIGGSLTNAVLDRARESGVPYATVHYAEYPELFGYRAELPGRDHVKMVKGRTREAKKRLLVSRAAIAG